MTDVQTPDVQARFVRLPSIAERKLGVDFTAPVRLDPRVLDQMQETIRELSARYSENLKTQVGSLFSFIEPAGAGDAEAWNQLYAMAHEIRGLAGTFGYPTVGRFAHSLCGYLENYKSAASTVMRFHVEAMYDAVQSGGADEILASETLMSLERLIALTHEGERSAG
ncbi:Hpt domain-containing protein [Parvibaculum sp.]|uniref:Hpt domain-containing protein n=1 Tax=Parvibaculum sp. TaxID=2024848 RepID=UPI00320EADE3